MLTLSTSTIVLRKRKERPDAGVLLLSSEEASDVYAEESESEESSASTISVAPVLSRKSSKSGGKKRFSCTFDGCSKTYTKPSRLAEHERSHTGDRPFVCPTCHKSYLRDSHLQAHVRSHLPYSDRPYECEEDGCSKRFWTPQHLRVHMELHTGEKPFKCTEESCTAAFIKHHMLREHICKVHAPPGTKPYRCEHAGCTKSFATNQKLRTHAKTHDDARYTCAHASCLEESAPTYYPTWSALQHHVRTTHPPTCPYPACNGKTFSSQKGLRAHLRIHEQREEEEKLLTVDSDAEDDPDEPPRKKRRGGELGRDWVCDVPGCSKDFKSKKALTNHRNVNHLGRRDFVCPHESCRRAFGYKHLLQRHLAKLHASGSDGSDEQDQSDDGMDVEQSAAESSLAGFDIDDITGKNYSVRSRQLATRTTVLRCPHPDLHGLEESSEPSSSTGSSKACEYVFSRAYDFRRHLRSEHGLDVEKDRVDDWVKAAKRAKATSS